MLCVFTNFEALNSSAVNKASRLSDWKLVEDQAAYSLTGLTTSFAPTTTATSMAYAAASATSV
jgi:hypothetical protein